jgi:large subunit ribosomal protein L34e
MRKLKKKVAGGSVMRFEKKKPSRPVCSVCRKPLSAVKKGRAVELKKLPKSKKKPNRPYGGQLCSACMREEIREKIYRR